MTTPNIVVVGDVILDHTIHVEPVKIAQEAPVIAYRQTGHECHVGGAALVNDMVRGLGRNAELLQFTRPGVTQKFRYVTAGNRNPAIVFRLDHDVYAEPTDESVEQAAQDIARMSPAVILISDYGKGMITRKMVQALTGIPGATTLVDPYTSDWSKYFGADIILPSRAAAANFLNDGDLRGFAAVITKLDRDGCRLYGAGPIEHYGSVARNVVDVTGAGDQFIATLACYLGKGKRLNRAVYVANVAAGLQVERQGTQPVTPLELQERLEQLAEARQADELPCDRQSA